MLFLPDLNKWDPYDDAYAVNEDSFLDSRGEMMLRGPTEKLTPVEEVYLYAVEAKGEKKVELDEEIDAVIASYHIATCAESARRDGQLSEE